MKENIPNQDILNAFDVSGKPILLTDKEESKPKRMGRREFIKLVALGAAAFATNPVEAAGSVGETHEKKDMAVFAKKMNELIEQHTFSGVGREKQFRETLLLLKQQCEDDYPKIAELIQQYSDGAIDWDRFIQPMTVFFAEKGYFFNAHKVDLNGELFIPTKKQAVKISENDNRGLSRLFPEDKTGDQFVFTVHDDRFIANGTTEGGIPFVNEHGKAAEQRRQLYFSSLPETEPWGSYGSQDSFRDTVNNEVAHAILYNKYQFTPQSKHDWSDFETDNDLRIANSQQAHEFISDAASIGTDARAYAKNIFNAFIKQITLQGGVSAEYVFSEEFALGLLKIVYDKKDLSYAEIQDEISTLREAYQARRFTSTQLQSLVKNVLENFDQNDLAEIQNSYLSMGKKILDEIETKK